MTDVLPIKQAEPAAVRLSDGTLLRSLVDAERGIVSTRIMSDPEIYRLELERIFTRNWIAVGHESEIPDPGDYVLRFIGTDQVIVSRDSEGDLHILLNSCSHRRMAVCRAELGNATHFRCPYHGFVYRNTGELIGVPALREAYGKSLDKSTLGLVQARCETYAGLIFGCFDESAPSLKDYLGDFTWYLDLMLKRTPQGSEVLGPPHRMRIHANWKLGAENFGGDAYHVPQTHKAEFDMALVPPDQAFTYFGGHVRTAGGHSLGVGQIPPGWELPPYMNLPAQLLPLVAETLTSEQAGLLATTTFMHGNVFPNLSFLHVGLVTEEGNAPVPMTTFRVWIPVGPMEVEEMSWSFVEREAPAWYRDLTRKSYVRTFGTSGIFEQDDFEIFAGITRSTASPIGSRQQLNYQMGMHKDPVTDWPGPGIAIGDDFSEANQRAFYERWVEELIRV